MKGNQGALVASVARGATVVAAAEAAGVSERTARRRLADPAVQREVEQARGELLDGLLGQLSDAGAEAADRLRALLDAESETTRLGACRAVLGYLLSVRELVEVERRMGDLERRLERRESEDGAW